MNSNSYVHIFSYYRKYIILGVTTITIVGGENDKLGTFSLEAPLAGLATAKIKTLKLRQDCTVGQDVLNEIKDYISTHKTTDTDFYRETSGYMTIVDLEADA